MNAKPRLDPLAAALRPGWRRPTGGTLWLLLALGAVAGLLLNAAAEPARPPRQVGEPAAPGPNELLNLKRKELDKVLTPAPTPDDASPTVVDESNLLGPVPPGQVRAAAVQFCPHFGELDRNWQDIQVLVRRAAKLGAKLIALPEAALCGYAAPNDEIYWSAAAEPDENHRSVAAVAEGAAGRRVRAGLELAKELGVYLTLPFIETDGQHYYSAVILANPRGEAALHYRKRDLWPTGDAQWATPGDLGVPVVATEYGRLAVVVSYDLLRAIPELTAGKVDIILHCAAYHGQNYETYLRGVYTRQVVQVGAHSVLANWVAEENWEPWWRGWGLSRIVSRQGQTLARVQFDLRPGIVIHDLPPRETP